MTRTAISRTSNFRNGNVSTIPIRNPVHPAANTAAIFFYFYFFLKFSNHRPLDIFSRNHPTLCVNLRAVTSSKDSVRKLLETLVLTFVPPTSPLHFRTSVSSNFLTHAVSAINQKGSSSPPRINIYNYAHRTIICIMSISSTKRIANAPSPFCTSNPISIRMTRFIPKRTQMSTNNNTFHCHISQLFYLNLTCNFRR